MIWLSVLAGLLLAVVAGVLFSPFWALLGIVPPLVLNLVVRGKARKVRKDFGEQLPENLDVLASALRAGHSLAGAMGVVADEAPEPSKREFTRVVTDEQLGIPLDEALEVTAKRMQNTDIDQVAVLALIQREAGGNTAEVLDQVTMNIRARMDIRRLVTVLTAQGKFSAVVVACVPLGIFLFLMLVNPEPPRPAVPPDPRAGRGDQRDLHDAARLLRHPAHRHDRALTMIHLVLILGLFLLAIAVTMVLRALTTPAGPSTETLEQISAYGFAGTLPTAVEQGPSLRTRMGDITGATGEALSRRFSRLRGKDYRARLISAGMYTTTPERLLGTQFLGADRLPCWCGSGSARSWAPPRCSCSSACSARPRWAGSCRCSSSTTGRATAAIRSSGGCPT